MKLTEKLSLLLLLVAFATLFLTGCNQDKLQQVDVGQPTPTLFESLPSETPSPTTEPTLSPTSTPSPTPTSTPTPTPVIIPDGPFEKNALHITQDIAIGWNLGNTLDAIPEGITDLSTETSWGNPRVTKELIDTVKEAGFNAIRVPVSWGNHLDENNRIDPAWLERVYEIVGYILDHDMYCILNMHHDTGTEGWLRASRTNEVKMRAKYQTIWEQIATRFTDCPDKLLFESFNEILTDSNDWNAPPIEAVKITNELNQLFVDTVRSTGGNNALRCLVVNTYAASTEYLVISNFVLPTDTVEDRLIVEAHVYAPFQFTHEDYPNNTTFTENSVKSPISSLFTNFLYKGIPVIIGEFGCADKNNDIDRVEWAKYFIDTTNRYGIKCFWWDNGSQYSLISRNRNEISEPFLVDALITEAYGGDYTINKDSIIAANADPNICADKNKWGNWIDVASGAKASMLHTANGVSMTVENSGKNEWDAQPSYNTITLEQGVTYRLSFDYVGTVSQTMSFTVQQNYGSFRSYFSDSLPIETNNKHYEATFTMTEPTDVNAKVSFNFGASEYTVYTNTIENLSLLAIE